MPVLSDLLTGSAQQVLGSLQKETRDYKKLIKALQARFDPNGRKELHRAQLKNRRQKASESLIDLADETRQLVEKVYSDLPLGSRDRMGRDHFLDALNDGEIRTRVIQMRTQTLDEAVAAAVELEALYKAEKERRSSDIKKLRTATVEVAMAAKTTDVESPVPSGLQEQLSQILEKMQRLEKQVNSKKRFDKRGPQCYQCKQWGHVKANCPVLAKGGDGNKHSEGGRPSAVGQDPTVSQGNC